MPQTVLVIGATGMLGEPVARGLETRIGERLAELRALDDAADPKG